VVLLLTAILLGNGCRKPQKIAAPILKKTSSKGKECSAEAPKANQYREKPKTLSPLEKLIVKTEQERAEKEQERAEKEQERAEKEQERAEKEQERAEKEAAQVRIVELELQLATRRIALNLLSINMPIGLISSITGLSVEEVEDLR
jgi:multidrug resistance efflux pump